MKLKEKTLEQLGFEEVLLTRVRKVHNTDPDAKTDYKIQIEGAEFIENPFRPINAAGAFNAGDSRFTGNLPRRGWVTMEPENWPKFFPNTLKLSDIEKLEFSSRQDNVDPADQKEGVHYLTLGIVNPVVEVHGKKFGLGVHIVETTTRRNEQQPAKINPSTGEAQTVDGKNIYVTSTLDFCKFNAEGKRIPLKSTFLVSDQMKKAAAEGRFTLEEQFNKEAAAAHKEELVVVTGPGY